MHVRALVKRDLLALQVGDRLDWAILRHDDRLALRRGGLVTDIEKRCASSLGKNRRRVAAMGKIDRACLDPFEKLRPARKFLPSDCIGDLDVCRFASAS